MYNTQIVRQRNRRIEFFYIITFYFVRSRFDFLFLSDTRPKNGGFLCNIFYNLKISFVVVVVLTQIRNHLHQRKVYHFFG